MNNTHTPGPWKTDQWSESVWSEKKRICIIVPQGGSLKPQDKENAKLIAAAPDLLEALIELQQMVEVGEMNEGTMEVVRNAIKKATE
jgi:hypothetical protein